MLKAQNNGRYAEQLQFSQMNLSHSLKKLKQMSANQMIHFNNLKLIFPGFVHKIHFNILSAVEFSYQVPFAIIWDFHIEIYSSKMAVFDVTMRALILISFWIHTYNNDRVRITVMWNNENYAQQLFIGKWRNEVCYTYSFYIQCALLLIDSHSELITIQYLS